MEGELFAEVKSEGNALDIDKAFERLETKEDKTPSASQPEKKDTVKPSQGGDNTPEEKLPFHKHPRWIKTQETLKEYKDRLDKYESERNQSKAVELPKWYVDRYGDTEESKANYQAIVQKDGELDWLKQSILGEIDQRKEAETQSQKEADEYVDTQLQELTDEGLKFERNSLLKFMVDFQEEFGAGSLLDAEGNYDFRKGIALMEKFSPEEPDGSIETKKQLAGNAGRSKPSSSKENKIPVLTRKNLRGKGGWRDAGI